MKAKWIAAAALLASTVVHAQEEADRKAGATTSRMLEVDQAAGRQSPVIPTPQETYWGKASITLGANHRCNCTVDVRAGGNSVTALPDEFAKRLRKRFGASMQPDSHGIHFVFALKAADDQLKKAGAEAYTLKASGRDVLISGNSAEGLWHGMATLAQLISDKNGTLELPELDMLDYPQMSERTLLVDVGGQGYMVGPSRWNLAQWEEFVDWMVDHKLNNLWLEFIGSGRLMGNLKMEAGEWIGFPLALKSYPQLVEKDRPIKRWDEAQGKVVQDTYTAPNVKEDFVARLIDYAQARGVKCYLLVGYDYFANQLPVVMGIPANDPRNAKANKVYDDILREIVERYKNASGVVLCTIENKEVPPSIIHDIVRRTRDGYNIVKAINPKMKVGLLPDYLEWQPNQLDDLRLLKQTNPEVFLAYSPHREPQQRAWQRVHGDIWRYVNFSQYAWDHVAYIFPEQIRDEMIGCYLDGYRKVVTQAWYADVFMLNYLVMAEFSWNPTGETLPAFWDRALRREFGERGGELMRTALQHTRFDLRHDLIARMILEDKIDRPFSYWDMYMLHRFNGLTDSMLADLEKDARESLVAAQAALPVVPTSAREMVEVVITSAERRLYLATSCRHLLKALALRKAGQLDAARQEMAKCISEGEKMYRAATKLGIEFPLSVHDDEVLEKYRQLAKP